jgi:pimeloyl-ACP methyl ester carboxylesterase
VADALGAGPEPSLEVAADAVAATLAALGVTRAVVAGLSMGGYTALALLERHPGLVAGLALLDTRSTPDDDAARARRLRVADAVLAAGDLAELSGTPRGLLGAPNRDRADLVDRVAGWIGEQTPAGVAWSQRAMAARPDRTAVLSRFAGPAIVLVGAGDELTPVATAEHMAAALQQVELVVVPRAGHLTPVEDPAAVAVALTRLLGRVGAGV